MLSPAGVAPLLPQQNWGGPEGMAMAPPEKRPRLDDGFPGGQHQHSGSGFGALPPPPPPPSPPVEDALAARKAQILRSLQAGDTVSSSVPGHMLAGFSASAPSGASAKSSSLPPAPGSASAASAGGGGAFPQQGMPPAGGPSPDAPPPGAPPEDWE